jgi:hypothetical protein
MWLFASGGLLLPALIPEKVLEAAKTPDIVEAKANGWDLQVRGRVTEHLTWFAGEYMLEGDHSAIVESPDKDYNARFYTSREAYGMALYRMSLAIDYTKFKDTSLKFPWGKKYHDLLLSIWSMSQRLAPAGGFYGAWSKDNPRGYRGRRTHHSGLSGAGVVLDRPLALDDDADWGYGDLTDDELDYLEEHGSLDGYDEEPAFVFDPNRDYSVDPSLTAFLDTFDRERQQIRAREQEQKSRRTRNRFNRKGKKK